jgi:hypothetical protein
MPAGARGWGQRPARVEWAEGGNLEIIGRVCGALENGPFYHVAAKL